MTIEVTASLDHDAIFRKACDELDISYTCIREMEQANRYELHLNYMHDLYFLGRKVGSEIIMNIYSK